MGIHSTENNDTEGNQVNQTINSGQIDLKNPRELGLRINESGVDEIPTAMSMTKKY